MLSLLQKDKELYLNTQREGIFIPLVGIDHYNYAIKLEWQDEPFDDQWAFLKTINRITISQLNYIYKEQTDHDELSTGLFQKEQPIAGKLSIVLNNEIHVNRIGLPASVVSFLKEELNQFHAQTLRHVILFLAVPTP